MSIIVMREELMIFRDVIGGDYPFKMVSAGTSYCDGTYRISRRDSPIYVFEYVEKGCGYLRINGDEFEPEAGDVYIVPYGSDHEYGSSGKNPWIKYWFNVSGKVVGDLLSDYKLNSTYLYKNYPLKNIFTEGLKELNDNQAAASTLIGPKIIFDIILNLSAHREYLHEKISFSPAAKRLQLFLDRKVFGQAPTLDEMCRHVNLSPAQVNRLFKKDFGHTPYQYLLNLKVAAAKELLTTSVKKIKDIAFSLGFSDEYYFSNIFKKKTGLAPRNYRIKAGIIK